MATQTTEHPLRKWRKSKGLTLEAAAQRVGTTRQVWWGWEQGRRRPNATFMPRVRKVTCGQVTADDFYERAAETPQRDAA